MNDERIVIDFDNEDEESASNYPQQGKQIGVLGDTFESDIVITLDDLDNVEDFPRENKYNNSSLYYHSESNNYEQKSFNQYNTNSFLNLISGINDIVLALILGALGGLISFLVNEPFINDGSERSSDVTAALLRMGFVFMWVGAFIGMCLGSLEGIRQGSLYRIGLGALKGLGIGAVGGFLAGTFGQTAFTLLLSAGGENLLIIARTIGWGFAGAFIGISQGIAKKLDKRVIYGFIGGICGGVIGGLLFDIMSIPFNSGTISRLIGDTIVGSSIGIAIYMVENIAKQAWIRILDGPLKGKEFILFSKSTTFGNSPKCDILIKDMEAMPIHGRIDVLQGNKYVVSLIDPAGQLFVNNIPVSRQFINNKDIIGVGDTHLLFELKSEHKMPYMQRKIS